MQSTEITSVHFWNIDRYIRASVHTYTVKPDSNHTLTREYTIIREPKTKYYKKQIVFFDVVVSISFVRRSQTKHTAKRVFFSLSLVVYTYISWNFSSVMLVCTVKFLESADNLFSLFVRVHRSDSTFIVRTLFCSCCFFFIRIRSHCRTLRLIVFVKSIRALFADWFFWMRVRCADDY